MNYKERRAYNHKHHTKYTKEQFEVALALARMQGGTFDIADMSKNATYVHADNEEIAPNGCLVKINYENIYKRPQEMLTEKFKTWIEENKDREFHIERDDNAPGFICFKEDIRHHELDGEVVEEPKWLFDLYNDLLVMHDGEYVEPYKIGEHMKEYMPVTEPSKMFREE